MRGYITFLSITKIIWGRYYEHFTQVKEDDLFYLDEIKTSVVS